MDVASSLAVVSIIGIIGILLPIIANILQNGVLLDDHERSKLMASYQTKLDSMQPDDLRKFTKSEVYQLFQILPPVDTGNYLRCRKFTTSSIKTSDSADNRPLIWTRKVDWERIQDNRSTDGGI